MTLRCVLLVPAFCFALIGQVIAHREGEHGTGLG